MAKPRSVVSAEWVPLAAATAEARTLARVPEGYTSNESSTGGRLIAIAVDEPHIRPGGAQAVLAAANAFIDRLSPSDRIAAVSLGLGSSATPFIADRARVKEAIGRMAGQRDTMKISSITVTGTEALEIADGNRLTADQVVARECSGLRPGSAQLAQCRQDVETEALMLGRPVEAREPDDDARSARRADGDAGARRAENADPDVGRIRPDR